MSVGPVAWNGANSVGLLYVVETKVDGASARCVVGGFCRSPVSEGADKEYSDPSAYLFTLVNALGGGPGAAFRFDQHSNHTRAVHASSPIYAVGFGAGWDFWIDHNIRSGGFYVLENTGTFYSRTVAPRNDALRGLLHIPPVLPIGAIEVFGCPPADGTAAAAIAANCSANPSPQEFVTKGL